MCSLCTFNTRVKAGGIASERRCNPKGLGSDKVGDSAEEDKDLQEGRDLYIEAIRRGTKRLSYKNEGKQDQEVQEADGLRAGGDER